MELETGFTLYELLIVLAIAMIVFSLSMPTFNHLMQQHTLSSRVNDLHRILNYARTRAITRQKPVTLCPTDRQKQCIKTWGRSILLFVDRNADGKRSPEETVINHWTFAHETITLHWRSFRRRASIQFNPDGSTFDNGTLSIQIRNELSSRLILSRSGRVRVAPAS